MITRLEEKERLDVVKKIEKTIDAEWTFKNAGDLVGQVELLVAVLHASRFSTETNVMEITPLEKKLVKLQSEMQSTRRRLKNE